MGRPIGVRGEWFARWKGEAVPCVHQHWCCIENKRMAYRDPFITASPKWEAFVESIRQTGRVILTKDKVGPQEVPSFSREGYIALFEVADVQMTNGVLEFRFVERLEDFN